MNTPNNNKYVKGSPEWEKRIIGLVGKEIDQEFKKGQKKPDGTEVTADQETIKVNDVKQLLTEIKSQKQIVENKLEELGKKKGYKGEALALFKLINDLEPKIKDWKTFTDWYKQAHERFLKGGTNGYGAGNVGWVKVLKAYLEQKYSKANSTALTEDYDNNLYRGTFQMGQLGNDHTQFRITENEAVKLITRVVKEISKIKKTEFNAYVNGAGATTLPNGFNRTEVITWMDNIRDRAQYLVDNTIKGTTLDENGNKIEHPDKGKPANGHRIEYSFGDDYTKNDGSPVATNNFTHIELEQLFNLMRLFGDYGWVSHNDLKPALTEIKGDTLILLPAAEKPIPSSKFKSEEFGIEGYVDTNGNSNFYATNYGTRISDGSEYRPVEYSWDSKFEVKVEDNLNDWAHLINSFASEGYGDEKNKNKLISSFTNDPIKQLFADLRSYDTTSSTAADKGGTGTDETPNYDIFKDGTNNYFAYQEFPAFYLDEELRLESLKVNKDVIAQEIKTGSKELEQAEKDYQAARKQLFAKEKELDNKITAKITELHQELKEKYKVSDTEANDFTDDNKITRDDHGKFQKLVKNIRFLVNNDEEKLTGKTNEDQAYQASQDIFLKAFSTWLQASWDSIGWQPGADEKVNYQRTDEERIAVIKENKDDKYTGRGLNWWHDSLIELEKLVKLSERETEIKTALKKAIDNQTPEENAKDWQNNLKAIEIGLETAFTEEKIKKWKEKKDGQPAFNTITSVNSLLKKVCQDGKVNEDFLTFLKGKDSELASLEKLIEKKEPKEVILLIHQWEYNKLDDPKKAERHLRYAWSELGGKKKVDSYELTDEDKKSGGNFEKFLYECAIGKINYNSLKKPTEQENSNDNSEGQNPQWWEKGFYWPIWTSALVIIGGLIAWWKRTDWFGGKKEEEGEETELEKETSEDED